MFCHCLAVLGLLVAAGNASIYAGAAVPVADLEKIRSAASFEAPAKPQKPRNVLIFSRADGYIHDYLKKHKFPARERNTWHNI